MVYVRLAYARIRVTTGLWKNWYLVHTFLEPPAKIFFQFTSIIVFLRLFWSAPQAKIFYQFTSITVWKVSFGREWLHWALKKKGFFRLFWSAPQAKIFYQFTSITVFLRLFLERAAGEDFLPIHFYSCIFAPFLERAPSEDILPIHFYNCLKIVRLWCRLA